MDFINKIQSFSCFFRFTVYFYALAFAFTFLFLGCFDLFTFLLRWCLFILFRFLFFLFFCFNFFNKFFLIFLSNFMRNLIHIFNIVNLNQFISNGSFPLSFAFEIMEYFFYWLILTFYKTVNLLQIHVIIVLQGLLNFLYFDARKIDFFESFQLQ